MNFGRSLKIRMNFAIILPMSSALNSCFPSPNFSPDKMMVGMRIYYFKASTIALTLYLMNSR